ncbi:MAG TPA: EamA family transporter [Elusimicrobia bacterium]|nr:EamA family transporter [Elusimicrobiota bacterium]
MKGASEFAGMAAALASAAAWAGGSVLYKKLGERTSAPGMNLVKSILSLGILAFVLFLTGFQLPGRRTWLILTLSGLLGVALGDTFFFLALQRLNTHVLVLLCALGPALTILFAVFFLGEIPPFWRWIGIVMVLSGVALVLDARGSHGNNSSTAGGIVYGLLSILCMSTGVIVAKVGLASVGALEAVFIRMLAGAAGLALWAVAAGRLREWVAPFWDRVLLRDMFVAICVCTLGGFWLSHVALKFADVSVASTLAATEPLFVMPLAAIFLEEPISRKAVWGALVAVSGAAILVSR